MGKKTLSKTVTTENIQNMNYTDFIAFIDETNRCPGGKDTIRKIIQNSFINQSSRVLDIGSNTGFTSLEIAHSVKCHVEGIDISKACVEAAKAKLKQDSDEIRKRVNFNVASAYEIPFPNDHFDLVVTGGATSFMNNKSKAIKEYLRVLKPWGFLSVSQLFYREKPPSALLTKLNQAIDCEIKPWSEEQWLNIYMSENPMELYFYETHKLNSVNNKQLDNYIRYFINKKHISILDTEIKDAVKEKWREYLTIFNQNHKYLGFFIALFRKNIYPEEPELFKHSDDRS